MNALISVMFLLTSLILFSSDETSGGDGATTCDVSVVLSDPLSCAPLGAVIKMRKKKNKNCSHTYTAY